MKFQFTLCALLYIKRERCTLNAAPWKINDSPSDSTRASNGIYKAVYKWNKSGRCWYKAGAFKKRIINKNGGPGERKPHDASNCPLLAESNGWRIIFNILFFVGGLRNDMEHKRRFHDGDAHARHWNRCGHAFLIAASVRKPEGTEFDKHYGARQTRARKQLTVCSVRALPEPENVLSYTWPSWHASKRWSATETVASPSLFHSSFTERCARLQYNAPVLVVVPARNEWNEKFRASLENREVGNTHTLLFELRKEMRIRVLLLLYQRPRKRNVLDDWAICTNHLD